MAQITHKLMIRRHLWITFVAISTAFVAISGVSAASAASLSFSPSVGTYDNGQTFAVNVFVSSADAAMNAASGVISFSQDKLEVVSLSRTGSIISLWVQDPSFSNAAGAVNLEGIVLNPGFQGASGKLLSITFRAKGAGNASVAFSSGSVLANDGQGTNILRELGRADFAIRAAAETSQPPEGVTPAAIVGTPAAPTISSPTNPDPEKWYVNPNPKFSWIIPTGVTAVRLAYDLSPRSIPSVTYTTPITEKELKDVGDGIYYFHAQFKNSEGWGSISHFRFQIDTKPPERFSIRFVGDANISNPRPTVLFNTVDDLSGIDFYKVKTGDHDPFSVQGEEVAGNPYTLPPQEAGKHSILVQAFDRAGNYETAVADFTVLTIASPTFTEYPPAISEGNPFVVKGLTFPSGKVSVWLQREGDSPKRYTTLADSEGDFTVAVEGDLQVGQYQFWAEVEDERGAKSLSTDKFSFTVVQTAALRIGSFVVSVLAVVVSAAAILVLGGVLLWYGWRRFTRLRRGLRKEVREVERSVHNAFESLRGDVQGHIRALEKEGEHRVLSRDEEKMLNQLRKSLDKAEELIEKEVEDVEKKVK
ncbi:MAG: hypothetical protein V1656_03490 [Candidatus Jorgensenbacteria bacterium]